MILVLAAILLAPLLLLLLLKRAYTLLSEGLERHPNENMSFWEDRNFVVALAAGLVVTGYLYLLFSLAVTLLQYGLPPCESDEPVFWSRLACSAGLFVGMALLFLPRVSAMVRFALTAGVPTFLFGVQYFVISENVHRQVVCAARSLTEAMAACGAEPAHYRRGMTSDGFATLTLVSPGTTDRAWGCLTTWTYYADGAPSLQVDESVYVTARTPAKAAAGR